MYERFLILLITCLISGRGVSFAYASSFQDDSTKQKHFLDMKGQISYGKKKLDKVFVKIYSDTSSIVVQKMESDIGGWVAFQLPIQKTYTIKISKAGHVTKIISVDAIMPKLNEGDYYFEFSVDLFENVEGLDVSVLKNPIAKIFFNSFTKKFDYDYNYTVQINNDVKKLYRNYDLLKKQGNLQSVTHKETETEMSADTSKKTIIASPLTVIKSEAKIIFSVGIVTSSEQVPRISPRFKGILNVKEYQEGDTYKYYVGEYPSQAEAEKMKDRISGYFPDASIAAFKDGKKITLEEAMNVSEK